MEIVLMLALALIVDSLITLSNLGNALLHSKSLPEEGTRKEMAA
jgi:hypothetical protein